MRWADARRRRVEDYVGAFVDAVARTAEKLRERRVFLEERRGKVEEWQRQRAEKLRWIE